MSAKRAKRDELSLLLNKPIEQLRVGLSQMLEEDRILTHIEVYLQGSPGLKDLFYVWDACLGKQVHLLR